MPPHLFIKKRDITKNVKSLCDATKDSQRGEVVTHDDIEAASQIKRDERHYPVLIKKWKRHMLERGLWVRATIPAGTGYRVLTVEEQLYQEPERIEKQVHRKRRQSAACIGSIGTDELNKDQELYRKARANQLVEMESKAGEQKALRSSWLNNVKLLPSFQ